MVEITKTETFGLATKTGLKKRCLGVSSWHNAIG